MFSVLFYASIDYPYLSYFDEKNLSDSYSLNLSHARSLVLFSHYPSGTWKIQKRSSLNYVKGSPKYISTNKITNPFFFFEEGYDQVTFTPSDSGRYRGVEIEIPDECKKNTFLYNSMNTSGFNLSSENSDWIKPGKPFCVAIAPPEVSTYVCIQYVSGDDNDVVTAYTQNGSYPILTISPLTLNINNVTIIVYEPNKLKTKRFMSVTFPTSTFDSPTKPIKQWFNLHSQDFWNDGVNGMEIIFITTICLVILVAIIFVILVLCGCCTVCGCCTMCLCCSRHKNQTFSEMKSGGDFDINQAYPVQIMSPGYVPSSIPQAYDPQSGIQQAYAPQSYPSISPGYAPPNYAPPNYAPQNYPQQPTYNSSLL